MPYKEQTFRELFKKRKSSLIISSLIFCFILFGIAKSISFIASLIILSPFVVIFWSSFGYQIREILKYRKK